MPDRNPAPSTARALALSLLLSAGLASCAQPIAPPPGTPGATPTPAPTPSPPPILSVTGVSDPRGLAVDATGNLWLTNGASGSTTPAGRVLKLDASGATVDMVDLGVELGACVADGDYLWTVSSSPSVRLWRIGRSDLATASYELATGSRPVVPQGLAVDPDHRLWLADAGNDLVSVFADGVRLRDIAIPRATDSLGPTGVVVASESVWVAARGDQRVYQVRRADFSTGSVELPKPSTGVLGVDKNDLVWAGHDFFEGTLAVAKFASALTQPKSYDVGQDRPVSIVGDRRGYVWAALRERSMAARVTPADGTLVLYPSDAIVRPRVLAVDAEGNAWVASQDVLARIPAAP